MPLVLALVTLLPLFTRLATGNAGALAATPRPPEPPLMRAIRAHDAAAVAVSAAETPGMAIPAAVPAAATAATARGGNPLAPRAPHFAPRAKRVISMFQAGAPSHLELFDPKPELAKRDGTLTAAEAVLVYEAGAFKGSPVGAAMMTVFAPYKLANVRIEGWDVLVNKPKVAAYRAPGAPMAAPAAAPKAAPRPSAPTQPIVTAPGDQRIPHTAVRKVIARRMLESKQTVPHFYLTVEFEIDALLAARAAINEVARKKDARVSVNDMVIKACAKALRDHPDCNASWTEDEMVQYGAVDISVAVATDRGLITPIVRNADMKGVAQISIEMKDLATRAKDGKLKLDEFQGGGFTISNLGMFGVKEFAAIINPPQAMILAVGVGEERVVARKGQMVIRNMMSCTLAVDHRVVDGAMGAQFLQTLRAYIEQPAAMLV